MKLKHHAAISIVLSSILYMIFRSWGLTISCFITGIFIDVDYVVDYITQGCLPFSIKRFYQVYHEGKLLRVRLFHGWEWVLFWSLVSWVSDWNLWVVGILIGFGQHLFLDTVYQGESFLAYSLVWRWMKGFRAEAIFKNRNRAV